jgi:hypothetical protein
LGRASGRRVTNRAKGFFGQLEEGCFLALSRSVLRLSVQGKACHLLTTYRDTHTLAPYSFSAQ